MTPYGKTAQTAIAAVSRLAEVYATDRRVKGVVAQVLVDAIVRFRDAAAGDAGAR